MLIDVEHPMRHTVIAFAMCLLTSSLAAEIYRYEDENGNVVFTDRPMRNAKPVEAEVQNTYTEPTTPVAAASSVTVASAWVRLLPRRQSRSKAVFFSEMEAIAQPSRSRACC